MASLRDAFLASAPEELHGALECWGDLDAELTKFVERAATPFAGVFEIDGAEVLARAARGLRADRQPAQAFAEMRADEIALAWACGRGHEAAIGLFQERYLRGVRAALSKMGNKPFIDEIEQRVLTKLFGSEPPGIDKYAGRGKLEAWVQVVAKREAWAKLRKDKRGEQPVEVDALLNKAIGGDDPELLVLKRTYRDQFKLAFQQAFEALSVRERNVLRHELLDGMNIDKIGELYGVHRATVLPERLLQRGGGWRVRTARIA